MKQRILIDDDALNRQLLTVTGATPDRQTDREIDRQAGRQTDRQIDR